MSNINGRKAKPYIKSESIARWVVLAYSLLLVIPFYIMLVTSLKPTEELIVNPVGLPRVLRFDNYIEAIQQANIARLALNSIFVTTVTVGLVLAANVFCSFGLFSMIEKRLGNLIYSIIVAGLIIPGVGFVPLILMMRRFGLYNTHIGLILSQVAGSVPFATFLLVGFFRSVPKEYAEASTIDGCSPVQSLLFVLIHLIRPAIITVAIFNTVGSWNNLMGPLLLLRDPLLATIPQGLLVFKGQFSTQFNLMFAATIVTGIPLLILFLRFQQHFVKSLSGGVKG